MFPFRHSLAPVIIIHQQGSVAQPDQDMAFVVEFTNLFPAARNMNDRDNSVDGLPFGQFFVPSPIIPRNVFGMDCLPQFLLGERSDCLAVLGNVNRVFQTLVNFTKLENAKKELAATKEKTEQMRRSWRQFGSGRMMR